MLPGTYDIELYQGGSWSLELSYRDSTGSLVNFNGYSGQMQIRGAIGGTLMHELNTENGGIVLSDSEPNIRLNLPRSATLKMTKTGYYDLFVINGEQSLPVIAGRVMVTEAASHDG